MSQLIKTLLPAGFVMDGEHPSLVKAVDALPNSNVVRFSFELADGTVKYIDRTNATKILKSRTGVSYTRNDGSVAEINEAVAFTAKLVNACRTTDVVGCQVTLVIERGFIKDIVATDDEDEEIGEAI